MSQQAKGALIVVAGVIAFVFAFIIGMSVVGLEWWRIPLFVFVYYTFDETWRTVLSFVSEILFLAGLAGIISGFSMAISKSGES